MKLSLYVPTAKLSNQGLDALTRYAGGRTMVAAQGVWYSPDGMPSTEPVTIVEWLVPESKEREARRMINDLAEDLVYEHNEQCALYTLDNEPYLVSR